MWDEGEGEDPAHIDVLMHRRRNAGDQLVGIVGERVADDRLHLWMFQAMSSSPPSFFARPLRTPISAITIVTLRRRPHELGSVASIVLPQNSFG
jgi:hypothetical protein